MEIKIDCPTISSLEIDQDDLLSVIPDMDAQEVLARVDDDEIKDYCSAEFSPSEVFDEDQLAEWAEANGFVKEGE